jgi:AcrR family transcriptional regulator
MSMSLNGQDPRIIRTRHLLQFALLELMREKPFQSISVSDITKRATLNRSTFYLHYLDKFDLLAQTARDTFSATINGTLPGTENFRLENIRHLTSATYEYLDTFLNECSPANKPYEPLIEAELQRVLYDYIFGWLSGLDEGSPDRPPIETMAVVVSASVLAMSLKSSRGEVNYALDEVVEQVYAVVTQGIVHAFPATQT